MASDACASSTATLWSPRISSARRLFEEADARDVLPKAVAAERRLAAINSDVRVEGVVADLGPDNAEELLGEFPLLLDGTDNFETRLLVNDFAVSRGKPWVYAAAVSSYGDTMPIRPGHSPACSRLLYRIERAACGRLGRQRRLSASALDLTRDTIGVLGAAAGVIASLEAASAMKLLLDAPPDDRLVSCDVWTGRFQSIRVSRRPDCRACGRREFSYLDGRAQPHLTLCGRDSVQIHERRRHLDLAALGRSLAAGGHPVRHNDFLLRLGVPPYELTVFADGRAIVKGTRDPAVARTLYARFVGN